MLFRTCLLLWRFPVYRLLLGLFAFSPFLAKAAPVVENASFEAHGSTVWPGITPILHWNWINPANFIFQNSGINPCLLAPNLVLPRGTLEPNDNVWGVNVFSNNGQIPDGNNVAFIWGTGKLSQTVTNFEAGKAYAVAFYYNCRAFFPTPNLYVSLGGQEFISGDEVTPAGEVEDFDAPYHRGMAGAFRPTTTGNYDLVFENRTTVDSTLLLDHIRILELGNLALVSAERDGFNATQVTVKFSHDVDPVQAADRFNYSLSNGGTVMSARMGADAKTVLLTTSFLPRQGGFPLLRAIWITDTTGKGMLPENDAVQITAPPVPPVSLQIERGGDQILISWPAGPASTGLALFRTPYFEQVIPWEYLGEYFEEVDGRHVHREPIESGSFFYVLDGTGPP